MNFDKTEYNNSFTKSQKSIFFKKKLIVENPFQKLIPTFQLSNYTTKNKKPPLFLRTSNLYFSNSSLVQSRTHKSDNYTQIKYFKKINSKPKLIQIKKIKIKKSLSEIFQNNDIDLVRNLNIDSMTQFNKNLRLKENLINLSQDYFKKSKEKKMNKIIFDYINDKEINEDSKEEKNKKEKLPMLNRNIINKSYELLQAKNRELKLEASENAEKEVINKIKILRKEMNIRINKKKELFDKIKEIDDELREYDEENQFIKELYLKEISDISKDKNNGIDIFDEIIKYKIKSKFYTKNQRIKDRQSLLRILNLRKNKTNLKDESLEDSSEENEYNKEATKQGNKRLVNFEKNMKKTNKKKKYDNLIKEQEEKMNELKKDKKISEEKINELEKEIDKYKKEEKTIVDKLMMSYKESLFKGKNVKSEGLVWLIKAIWNLGENVPMSFMPNFLDCESIDYLFKLARKQNSMESLTKKILEIKMKLKKKVSNKTHFIKSPKDNENKSNEAIDNNKSLSVKEKLILRKEKDTKNLENEKKKDKYKDLINKFEGDKIKFEVINMPEIITIKKLEKQIQNIKEEISELKKNEIDRIIKCFIEKNYENIFHTDIETVLAALIGLDEKDTEVNRFNVAKRNYLSSIKQIRFYDHNYVSKKLQT